MSGRHVELSASQVIASMLATVSGAVAASYLGIAGTLIGAALGSFASTAGTAVYRHYLTRTEERLKAAAVGVVHRAGTWGQPGLPEPDSGQSGALSTEAAASEGAAAQGAAIEVPAIEVPAGEHVASEGVAGQGTAHRPEAPSAGIGGAPDQAGPGGTVPQPRVPADKSGSPAGQAPGPMGGSGAGPETATGSQAAHPLAVSRLLAGLGHRRWLVAAGAGTMVFLLGMAGITLFESATGRPLDATVWGRHNSGTTLGNAVGTSSRRPRHSPSPSSPSPSSPAPAPAATPTSSAPSPPASTAPPSPSLSPSPPVPSTTPPASTPGTSPTPGAATSSP